jgi:hypothetical protein
MLVEIRLQTVVRWTAISGPQLALREADGVERPLGKTLAAIGQTLWIAECSLDALDDPRLALEVSGGAVMTGVGALRYPHTLSGAVGHGAS